MILIKITVAETSEKALRPANGKPGAMPVTLNIAGTNLGSAGSNSRLLFNTPLANNASSVLGAWAIANSPDYAAYTVAQGAGAVGSAGYVGYDTGFASGNINS